METEHTDLCGQRKKAPKRPSPAPPAVAPRSICDADCALCALNRRLSASSRLPAVAAAHGAARVVRICTSLSSSSPSGRQGRRSPRGRRGLPRCWRLRPGTRNRHRLAGGRRRRAVWRRRRWGQRLAQAAHAEALYAGVVQVERDADAHILAQIPDAMQQCQIQLPIRGAQRIGHLGGGGVRTGGGGRECRSGGQHGRATGEMQGGGLLRDVCTMVCQPALHELQRGVDGIELEVLALHGFTDPLACIDHVLSNRREGVGHVRLCLPHRRGTIFSRHIRRLAPVGDGLQVGAAQGRVV
eukprot:scaffold3412_cov124-Isochrysis_galbana.AAC.4